jgi:adenylate kinase
LKNHYNRYLVYLERRVFLVGAAGSNRKENALALADYFGWACISMGDLLKKEVSKKTEFAPLIQDAFRLYRYVPDHIVIELAKRQIAQHEKDGQSWIMEGFPRT